MRFEHRIYIPDSTNHTEVKIVDGTGYSVGNQSSALKIDPVITERRTENGLTHTFTGVQLKFRTESVEEGRKAKVVFRNTHLDVVQLYILFNIKLDQGIGFLLMMFSEQYFLKWNFTLNLIM